MIALAMRILSIVPNSAATERAFSLMGIVHTDLRNRLDAERVHQTVLVRHDIDRTHGCPARKKHKLVSSFANTNCIIITYCHELQGADTSAVPHLLGTREQEDASIHQEKPFS